MKEFIYYRTYSDSGNGSKKEQRNFEFLELAKKDALLDWYNDNFSLYEVKLVFDDKITVTETKISDKIPCGRDVLEEKLKSRNREMIPRQINPKYVDFYMSKKFDKQQIVYYSTYSWVGPEYTTIEKRNFESIDLAIDDARNDNKNIGFTLSEIKLTICGKIYESTITFESKIKSGRDMFIEQSKADLKDKKR